jgi:multiple sugar transport system substrate-binding protein
LIVNRLKAFAFNFFDVLPFFALLLVFAVFPSGCRKTGHEGDNASAVVFKHGKIAGDPELFKALLQRFEEENPGIRVKDETLPSSTDEQHQFYVINLEGKSSDFDVIGLDVIWVQEFARAGWLRDVSDLVSEKEKKDSFPGPIEAVTYEGRLYAVPWYIDAGVLYYRKDLLEKYGFQQPRTWSELVKTAEYVTKKEPGLYGFIWQGKQYEGLVCNVLEYLWGSGGDVLSKGKVVIDSPENRRALKFLRNLIVKYKITPSLVTTLTEEPSRHIFGNGNALFMRNWPYAWNIFEKKGSAVRGKVGVSPLPSFPPNPSASTLGGWQLGINRYSRNPAAAGKLIRFLTSPEVEKELALSIGYKPPRKSLYRDATLMARQPFITGLYDVMMSARPRPISPYYMMMTQVMQPEFSAAISGIKSPRAALLSASEQINHIIGAGQ